MKSLGLNEIREKYLNFFESKGHYRMPSYSLIPQDDKSLLLINAGMAPLKKFFTGEAVPPGVRSTSCQKCVRVIDIENVGVASRHCTFFEMLGNFSFGDYFKREAITWAWEFLTKELEIPAELLHISVFEEDDEAYDIWSKEIGIAEDHLYRLDKNENFWEIGEGPCGPDSEIFFDRGEKYDDGSDTCRVGFDNDRYVEIWNLVFTQFYNDGQGNYTLLEKKNIDTGMGLERISCMLQGADSVYEIDTSKKVMDKLIKFSGIGFHEDEKADISLKVITDHIKSTTFLIGDGVMPSNEGRGYVLRRLLRRAARHGRLLGIEKPFLTELCETVIDIFKNAYPNLREKHDLIIKVIKTEEENFGRTIDAGMNLLDEMTDGTDNGILSGENAFKLSDTFGFPIDLTKEILSERGMMVDENAFYELIAEQKLRSRAARKDSGAEGWKDKNAAAAGLPPTEFLGYDALETGAKIINILSEGELAEYAESGQTVALILDKSVCYAESGGQAGDSGFIKNDSFVFEILSTSKTNSGVILHIGNVTEGGVNAGDNAKVSVDRQKRISTARNHTSAHLLQAALRKVLGSHVEQAGQMVNSDIMRFDFTHFSAMTREEIAEVEALVNEIILDSISVTMTEMPIEQAKAKGAVALFGEKYGDTVRVVEAGDFSKELCGGTHISNTAQIGIFKIISEASVAAGVRRIEAVTGANAKAYIDNIFDIISKSEAALKIKNHNDIVEKISSLTEELQKAKKTISGLSAQISEISAGSVFSDSIEINGIKLITAKVNGSVDELRQLCDNAKSKGENIIAFVAGENEKGMASFVCVCTPESVAKGAHAGNIVKAAAQLAGGSGGGRPDSAVAGARDISKIDEVLENIENIVRNIIQ